MAGLGLALQPSSEFIRSARAAAVCTWRKRAQRRVVFVFPVIKERDTDSVQCARPSSSLRRTNSIKVTFHLMDRFAKQVVQRCEESATILGALFSKPSTHRSRPNVNLMLTVVAYIKMSIKSNLLPLMHPRKSFNIL